jgi:hypothetical protein
VSDKKTLRISEDLALPLDAVTQKLAWLGRTGSGKTYGASKLAEEMLGAGAQVVILDAVGVWYGLRLAADGRGKGIEIPVFGGLHGDVPLEPTGGALLANLIVDRGISVVLDVSQLESDAAKARFAHEWGDRFFFRKKASPSAVHIFLSDTGHFGNLLSDLRGRGLIGDVARGVIGLTEEGARASAAFHEEAYDPGRLVEAWKRKFGTAETKTLDALLRAWPDGLTREEAGAAVGLRADTGHFGNVLSALRTNGLAETRDGRIVPHRALVER